MAVNGQGPFARRVTFDLPGEPLDEKVGATSVTEPAPPQVKPIVYIAMGLIMFAVAWFGFRKLL